MLIPSEKEEVGGIGRTNSVPEPSGLSLGSSREQITEGTWHEVEYPKQVDLIRLQGRSPGRKLQPLAPLSFPDVW